MKKQLALILATALLAALVLSGCGTKPEFGVSSNEDNTVSVTANKAVEDSAGIAYLTVGENEQVVIDAAFQTGGTIRVRFMAGLLGSEDFPDEPTAEVTVSDADLARFDLAPGEYTLGIFVDKTLTGTAVIYTQSGD